jgi:hypothetical protein
LFSCLPHAARRRGGARHKLTMDESPPTTPLKGLSIPDDALMEGAAPETETLLDTFSGMQFQDSQGEAEG